MANPILYHNPRCSKSRQALQYLEEKGLEFDVIEYLKTPLNIEELTRLFNKLKQNGAINSAHDMLRVKEAEYKLANLTNTASDEQVISALQKYPKLLERPIYENRSQAAIGRPLENIQAII